MLPHLSFPHWLTLHSLVTVVAVLIYIASSRLMRQRRQPTAAIAWILFILLLPYVALPAFLTFGSRKMARPRAPTRPDLSGARSAQAWAADTLVALGQPAPVPCIDLNVHLDGLKARCALLEVIDTAASTIDLCTFIMARDNLGDAVIEALCTKAKQGIRVRLLLDGLGSLMARPPDLRRLVAAGGAWALFVPPLHSPLRGRTNLRDHRKLLVVDAGLVNGRLWCGGRNLTSAYFDGAPDKPPWRDLSFDLRGPLVGQASELFEQDWAFANGRPLALHRSQHPDASESPADHPASAAAQLVASGPDQADDTIYALMVTAAYRAQERIALATPYFVPDPALLMALCMAAKRGVAVDLLLPGRSNHRLSDLARERSLRSLAQAGGRVWLAPNMMHAKMVVIDDTLALAGTANLDTRSLFLNYEVMFAFHRVPDVRRFIEWFDLERQTARPYAATPPGLLRDIAEGMLLWLGFEL